MSNFQVPAPPQATFEKPVRKRVNLSQPRKRIVPLDADFLRRVYRTNLVFGAFLSLGLAVILHSVAALLSSAAGVLSALLVLKAKELFVLKVVRPLDAPPYAGSGKWLPRWAIGIGKFVVIGAAIALLRRFE